jgi:hypothetical protein
MAKLMFEPDDELSQLAHKLSKFFQEQEGAEGVRLLVMLNREETTCAHNVGYENSSLGVAAILADVAWHLVSMGEVIGVDIDVYANGKPMPKGTGKKD